jgi:hypothetical protein
MSENEIVPYGQTGLQFYDEACRLLDQARRVDEVKEVRRFARGEPITSCVVVEAPAAPTGKGAGKSAGKTTPNQRRFIDILRMAILETPADLKGTTTVPNGAQAVTRDMLKKYLVSKGWMEEAESNKARAKVSDMLNVLAGKNLIGLTNMYVWMP